MTGLKMLKIQIIEQEENVIRYITLSDFNS